nr:hypothetical protein [Tanacetum cinerariifolium]
MDIHGNLREGDDTRVNLNQLHYIMRSFEGIITGLQQDTTVKVCLNPNFGFVDSTIEGHDDGDLSKASLMSGSAHVSCDDGFSNPKNTDHELGGPTSVPKSTLQNPKSVPSTYYLGVHLNNIKNYKSFNITLSSVEGVAEFFRVPLITQTASTRWKDLMDLKSATPDLGGDPVITKPNEVSPSDIIVKSIDIHEKPRSYVEAAGASAKDQPKANSNFPVVFVVGRDEGDGDEGGDIDGSMEVRLWLWVRRKSRRKVGAALEKFIDGGSVLGYIFRYIQ